MNGHVTSDDTVRRLRIAIFNRNFSSTGGGAERYSIAMVEALADRHEFHVFSQHIQHEWPGVTYHRVPHWSEKPRWLNQLFFATFTWWQTRIGFDVVHSHENTWHGQVQTVHVLPIKFNLLHGLTGFKRVLRLVKIATSVRLLVYLILEHERFSLKTPRQIVLASESLRWQMGEAYPKSTHAMSVVTPGVREVQLAVSESEIARHRHALGLPLDAFVILFVGNDYQKKGLGALLQAMPKLPKFCHLAVVGNRQQEASFQRLAQTNSVEDRVHFLGSLKDVGVAYQAANCLVHPTLEDTFAMVVLEAMAHGLPVVVSGADHCGISAQLTDMSNALILNSPTDSQTIFSAIDLLINDQILKEKLKQNALMFASDYLWPKLAAKQEFIYFSCVKDQMNV